MKKTPLVCWSLLLPVIAATQVADPAMPRPESTTSLTVSECHVYAYLLDSVVSHQKKRRSAGNCAGNEARPRAA